MQTAAFLAPDLARGLMLLLIALVAALAVSRIPREGAPS